MPNKKEEPSQAQQVAYFSFIIIFCLNYSFYRNFAKKLFSVLFLVVCGVILLAEDGFQKGRPATRTSGVNQSCY